MEPRIPQIFADGWSNPDIAIILDAALNTIKRHVQNLLIKLGAESRLAAALQAAEILGLGKGEGGRPTAKP